MHARPTMDDRGYHARGGLALDLARLATLVVGMTSLALVLAWLAGPPHLPETSPSAERMRELLTGSDVPAGDIAYLASTLAWIILAYLVLSVVLRSLALVVMWWWGTTRATRRLLRLTDVLTAPPLRRLTDGAVAGVMMASACLVPPARARAAVLTAGPALPAASAAVPAALAEQGRTMAVDGVAVALDAQRAPLLQAEVVAIPYTVVAGDTLWQIAERFYGDGHRYPEIVAANTGREMPTGERFGDPRLIRPGWVLLVPLPAANVEADGAELTYRVQPGDSLWRIAARLLGDGMRWPEIWDLNRGRDMGGGRTFASPGLLAPGWTLRVPASPVATVPDAPAPEAPSVSPTPAPVPPSPQPTPPASPEPPGRPNIAPLATPTPALEAPRPHDGRGGWPPDALLLVAGAAGLAASGAAVAIARRNRGPAHAGAAIERRRQHGPRPRPRRRPESAQGDVARVQLAARLALRALREAGFDDVRVLTCRESDEDVRLLTACPPGDAEAVADARFALARRLGGHVEARVLAGHQVELVLSRLRREAAALVRDDADNWHRLLLCPVGADADMVHYLNLGGLGSIRVVGTDGETTGLMCTWLATLAASVPADTYAVVPPSDRGNGTSALRDLDVPLWPPEGEEVADPVAAVATELAARLAGDATPEGRRAIIAFVQTAAVTDAGRLETLLRRGREAGIHTILLEPTEVGDTAARSPVPAEMYEATLLFAGADVAGDARPGELSLVLRGGQPVTLHPVTVPHVRGTELDSVASMRAGDAAGRPSEEGRGPRDASPIPAPSPISGPGPAETDWGRESGWAIMPPEDAREDRVAAVTSATDPDAQHPAELAELGRECTTDEGPRQTRHAAQPSLGADTPPADRELAQDTGLPVFAVRCFGPFEVELDGVPVMNWKVQKARELLAYLIARGGASVPREEAWEALWPEGDVGQMQRLLSDAAYHLRRTLKEASRTAVEPLTTHGQRYHLRAEFFQVDLRNFDVHLDHAATLPAAEALAEYERALRLFRGNVFGGEPFEWADEYRREYAVRMVRAAHAAARLALECRDLERAVGWYRQILAYDPIDEEAAQGLMRCFASVGDRNGVRKVYKVLLESLRRELDDPEAKPLPETEGLLRQLVGN